MIVEKKAKPYQPGWAQSLMVGEYKAQRPDNMRGGIEKYFSLLERLPYQTEFIMFEIAQPSVNKLGAGR